ncbi:MAG: ATP-dependent protease ATPase subunit HslU [Armatimonadota bacterium]|nr:MAG: ATP-dependent protease ATPase subunit HslU [Armatimonadota bacterium]
MEEDLTPQRIVEELDKYIIGQQKAKRAVAIALRNRYRRKCLPEELREEVIPKNILMIGPTGVGKTEIARRIAQLVKAPFIKVEATKFTEVGYVGRDVDSMVRDLVQTAVRMVEAEKMQEVQERAEQIAIERIVDRLMPRRARRPIQGSTPFERLVRALWEEEFKEEEEEPASLAAKERRERERRMREKLIERVRSGAMDDEKIEIEVEQSSPPVPFVQVFGPQGMEEMGLDIPDMLRGMMGGRRRTTQVTIREAKQILAQEAARELIDREQVIREAIHRTEESGIIFIDELDKIAGREQGFGPDVSREGVQRDLLPIIEGSTVMTKFGAVRTNHILFIAAGAFHVSKPSDLIPELQGRLPIRVELDSLTEQDFVRILTEPQNALVKQYRELLATEGVNLEFTDDAVREIAAVAAQVNTTSENIGARRLHTIMERVLEDISFRASEFAGQTVTVTAEYVRQQLEDVLRSEDLSKYIL